MRRQNRIGKLRQFLRWVRARHFDLTDRVEPAALAQGRTEEQKAQQCAQQTAYPDAQTSLAQATRNFDDAVTDYRSAAARAAHRMGSAISHDGLKDSWWDRNFGWVSTVFKIIAIVVVVLAVVALLLAMPWSAALLASMLGFFGAEVSVATLGAIAAGIGVDAVRE